METVRVRLEDVTSGEFKFDCLCMFIAMDGYGRYQHNRGGTIPHGRFGEHGHGCMVHAWADATPDTPVTLLLDDRAKYVVHAKPTLVVGREYAWGDMPIGATFESTIDGRTMPVSVEHHDPKVRDCRRILLALPGLEPTPTQEPKPEPEKHADPPQRTHSFGTASRPILGPEGKCGARQPCTPLTCVLEPHVTRDHRNSKGVTWPIRPTYESIAACEEHHCDGAHVPLDVRIAACEGYKPIPAERRLR